MDIIDVWLPILIILLSALSPLLKSLKKQTTSSSPQGIPQTETFQTERPHHTVVPVVHARPEEIHHKIESPASAIPASSNEMVRQLGLKNRSELKRAIILSEVLSQKYD